MGRKLNVSTPTVINTELIPLSESFYVEADGQLEQWYYENDGRYAPNRKVTPMTLTPHISVFDEDTEQSYAPDFYTVRWFKLEWDDTQNDYVETEITNQVDSLAADYVKLSNNSLLVKKNVGYIHSVTITCRAQYIDPRDSGITYNVVDNVLLTTNRDATILSPELNVLCPTSQAFNPLTDNHIDNGNLVYDSEFTIKATSDYSSVLATNLSQYKVDPLGTEQVIPANDTDIETCAPTMDIRYGDVEQNDQTFMERQTSGGQVPYIAGNMAYVNKINGNTVKFNQQVKNGNFANGTTDWNALYTTLSASNNELTVVVGNENVTFVGVCQSYTLDEVADNHKVYISAKIKTNNNSSGSLFCIVGHVNNPNLKQVFYTAGVNNQYVDVKGIVTRPKNNTEGANSLYLGQSLARQGVVLNFKDVIMLDLTDIFGSGNEPTTTAEVESWLAANIGLKYYYPYTEGELIPVNMSAIKSVGFNLWDEQWESGNIDSNGNPVENPNVIRFKNFVNVIGGTTYYCKCNYNHTLQEYKSDFSHNGYTSSIFTSGTFTVKSDTAYIKLSIAGTTYNNDICINISDAARNGTYEAHWEAEQRIPVTELKGRVNGTGDLVTIFPDGMNRVGDVYDEIKVEEGVVKAIKRVGSVDMGSLTWGTSTGIDYANLSSALSGANFVSTYAGVSNLLCGRYINGSEQDTYNGNSNIFGRTGIVYVKDANYSTGDAFATAMNGVYLYYELATPVEYVVDNMLRGQFEWYGVDGGTEVLADTLPWYKSGQHTDTLTVDAMYGEEIRVVLRARVSAGSDRLYPNKVYRSIIWKIPDVDINAYSENGGAVRSNTESMDFDTIVNVKGSVLDEVRKLDNLRFNWKVRKSNSNAETDFGWGQKRTIDATDLRNTIGSSSSLASTLVLPYGYLLGANEPITDSGEVVTDNDEVVYDRPVF